MNDYKININSTLTTDELTIIAGHKFPYIPFSVAIRRLIWFAIIISFITFTALKIIDLPLSVQVCSN